MRNPNVSAYERNILLLNIAKFLSSMHLFGGVLIPFFTDWAGITYLQITLLQSWFVLWVTLLEIPTGAVADFLGRKISVIIGLFVNVLAVFAYIYRPGFYYLLLAEFLWAMSAALISGADMALLYDSLKEAGKEKQSKKIIGRFSSFNVWGIVVAAPIGSAIGAAFGLNYPVMLMAIPLSLAAIVMLWVREPEQRGEKETLRYLHVLEKGIKYFFRHPTLKILAFDSIAVSAMSFFIVWLYQPMHMSLGLPLAFLGFLHSLCALSEVAVLNNFSFLEKIAGSKKNYILYSALILGFSYIILSLTSSLAVAMITTIFLFALGFTRKTLFSNYMNKYIGSDKRATVLSTISMGESLLRAVMYPIIGLVMSYSLNVAALVLGVLILGVTIFSRVEEHMLLD